MSDARGWGGKIRAHEHSAQWSITDRYFDSARDQEGILEYAIRPVTAQSKKTQLKSKDGKCRVIVRSDGWGDDGRNAVVMIVSGYGVPPTMLAADAAENLSDFTVGRDYFVTADRYDKDRPIGTSQSSDFIPEIPLYDIVLFYDDYDLSRVGLHTSITAEQLSLCYLEPIVLENAAEDVLEANQLRSAAILGQQGGFLKFKWRSVESLVQNDPLAVNSDKNLPDLRVERLPQMRAIIARNLRVPATFSLMYHAERVGEDHHDAH
ncbi:MAG: hypothetical protein J5I90_18065 [Caldilineales bacterium]|nr:hypothetical protein [Caldilineales bacterium]